MEGDLSEISVEGNTSTGVIFNGSAYSLPSLSIGADKDSVASETFNEVTNASLVEETGILVETSERGLFYLPVRGCLGEMQLLSSDIQNDSSVDYILSDLNGSDAANSEHSIGSSLFTVSSGTSQPTLTLKKPSITLPRASQPQAESPAKRKGGWPKGKKRKKVAAGTKPPKAPLTGYVIFLNRQRQFYKETRPDLAFVEVTKILGNEWSHMTPPEKQKYLDEAEADKQRYRKELREYQETEEYKEFLKRRRLKTQTSDSQVSSHFDCGNTQLAVDDLDDDEVSSELYCKVCDQFFNSLHNKKEHLYGRNHLQAIAGDFQKEALENSKPAGLEDETSTCDFLATRKQDEINREKLDMVPETRDRSAHVESAMHSFIDLVQTREEEISHLKVSLEDEMKLNLELDRNLLELQSLQQQKQEVLKTLKADETSLNAQLENLRMVPTLFGINNF